MRMVCCRALGLSAIGAILLLAAARIQYGPEDAEGANCSISVTLSGGYIQE